MTEGRFNVPDQRFGAYHITPDLPAGLPQRERTELRVPDRAAPERAFGEAALGVTSSISPVAERPAPSPRARELGNPDMPPIYGSTG